MEQAFYAATWRTLVQVGVRPRDAHRLPMIEFFAGAAAEAELVRDCLPPVTSRPRRALLQGRLDLDRFVSETIAPGRRRVRLRCMQRGEVLRSVVLLGADARGSLGPARLGLAAPVVRRWRAGARRGA